MSTQTKLSAATITGSNDGKASEIPAEGKGERQSAGTASGGSAQAPAFSNQKQGTPAGLITKPNNGGPAFPCGWLVHRNGMTLRDYFAAAALQGLCASPFSEESVHVLAQWSYEQADAMLAARGAEGGAK